MTTARIAEQDEDARRAAGRRRIKGGALRYLRRAAARRAIHLMLYEDNK